LRHIDRQTAADSEFAALYQKEASRFENNENVGLFIKNVENVQGDERDIIIFSMVYAKSPDGKLNRQFGWLSQSGGQNRLNVAVSRARKKIYFVSSLLPEEFAVDDLSAQGPKVLRKYMEYSQAVSQSDKNRIAAIFSSESKSAPDYSFGMDEEPKITIVDELCRIFDQKNIAYQKDDSFLTPRYDLAVIKDRQIRLLIETDISAFSNYSEVRERDFYKQIFLKSMNLRVYRIWSPYWYFQKEKIVKDILAFIDKV
jgi:hypothetical protein